jgi:hypothetical protein
MTGRRVPPVALLLLERLGPESGPLAGDLIESFQAGRSRAWFWWQVIGAILIARVERPLEIRPLRLVDLQPADAVERSRKLFARPRRVSLSASPLANAGGLGLVVLGFHISIVLPGAWWLVLGSTVAGICAGAVLVATHASPYDAGLSIRPR